MNQIEDNHFANLLSERSRVREIVILVPAIALFINMLSMYAISVHWLVQITILIISISVAGWVIARSPLFSTNGTMRLNASITLDGNTRQIFSLPNPIEMMKDPLTVDRLDWVINQKFDEQSKSGSKPLTPIDDPLSQEVGDILRDIIFFWIVDLISKEFSTSWAPRKISSLGRGHIIEQDSRPGETKTISEFDGFKQFTVKKPLFAEGSLSIGDKKIFLPKSRTNPRLKIVGDSTPVVELKWGMTNLSIAVEYTGGGTGLPPEEMHKMLNEFQKTKDTDALMEAQTYYAKVAEMTFSIYIAHTIRPYDVLGVNFRHKCEWIDAISQTIQKTGRKNIKSVRRYDRALI